MQDSLSYIQKWLKKWGIKVNGAKSVQVTFTTRREMCPLVTLNGLRIPQAEDVKYFRLHFDRRLNWRKHSPSKNNLELNWAKYTGCLVLAQIASENKLLMYKAILKLIWPCSVQECRTRPPNIEKVQRFQNKYLTNDTLRHNFNVPYVRDEIKRLGDMLIGWRNILTYLRLISRKKSK